MKSIIERLEIDYRIVNVNIVDENSYNSYIHDKKNLDFCCELELNAGKLISEINGDVNSVVVFFVPYLDKSNYKNKGNISKYARGKDYHLRSSFIFEPLITNLKEKYPNNKFIYQCDMGKINERFYAGISGLCMIGKNGNMIHQKYGSYGNLALIYTDLRCEEYRTDIKGCLNCGKCEKACPSFAIKSNGINNSKQCISYLTQKKQELTSYEKSLIKKSGYVFGCDICQDICPLNYNIEFIKSNDSYTDIISLRELDLSNKEFKNKYKEKAFSWRGKAILERNIKLMED